jgi:hypothetical protein
MGKKKKKKNKLALAGIRTPDGPARPLLAI